MEMRHRILLDLQLNQSISNSLHYSSAFTNMVDSYVPSESNSNQNLVHLVNHSVLKYPIKKRPQVLTVGKTKAAAVFTADNFECSYNYDVSVTMFLQLKKSKFYFKYGVGDSRLQTNLVN